MKLFTHNIKPVSAPYYTITFNGYKASAELDVIQLCLPSRI